ncbi:MAG: GNAT family N-acetyltransferase [Candidatus Kapaibacteriota bacterium]
MEKITVHEYKAENREEWESFVETSNNGTMFHKMAFLDYHPHGKFDFYHLMFRRGEELVAVLPGGLKENGAIFWSPVGASYGSIVTKDIPFALALEIVDTFMEFCKFKGIKEVFLIPPPLIYSINYQQHVEYAMLYRKFDFELHYISHSVPLNKGDYFKNIDAKARRIIRKNRREHIIQVRESNDYEAFYPILEKNKAKFNVKPTHSLEDLKKLEKLMPNNLKLFMAYYNETPVAGSLLFLTNKKVALCFYIMLLYEYNKYHPNFILMDETLNWAQSNGYEWFDIGVSQDTSSDDPMTPSLNLIYFKERFNSRGILRSTYHFKFD